MKANKVRELEAQIAELRAKVEELKAFLAQPRTVNNYYYQSPPLPALQQPYWVTCGGNTSDFKLMGTLNGD
jgi:hypothetical protein